MKNSGYIAFREILEEEEMSGLCLRGLCSHGTFSLGLLAQDPYL